ncbi:hypothetical protein ACLSZY_01420 [Avibacterium volantium]|uniref:hypothetical protein n=1 Tax=Avibacterium TaxID=292486 RepID=UPI0039FD202A
MRRCFSFKIFCICLFYSVHYAVFAQNVLSLAKEKDELTLSFQLENANSIVLDQVFKKSIIENKTITQSDTGNFTVTLRIAPIISEDDYDPLRLYSNGEFLLYSHYLFPEEIITKQGKHIKRDQDKDYPNILIKEDPKNYVLGERYVFFGKVEKIKILGLEKNKPLKNKLYHLSNEIFTYYSTLFGNLTKKSPIMILDFSENKDQFGYKGDALGNFLSYNINNVSQLNSTQYFELYKFVAHEIFHIWNAYEHKHDKFPWLHEGSADYFAFKFLADVGYIPKEKLEKIKNAYIAGCDKFYKKPKYQNTIMNDSNNDYSIYICGTALHIILEKLEDPDVVVMIWKEIFKQDNYQANHFLTKIQNNPFIKEKTKQALFDFIYVKGGVNRTINLLK